MLMKNLLMIRSIIFISLIISKGVETILSTRIKNYVRSEAESKINYFELISVQTKVNLPLTNTGSVSQTSMII